MPLDPESRIVLLRLAAVPDQATARPELLTVQVEAQVDYRSFYSAVRFVLDFGRLRAAVLSPDNEYGRYLGQRLSSCRPVELALAEAKRAARVRFQVNIDADSASAALHTIRWERLVFPDFRQTALGTRVDTPFSRFAAVNRGEEPAPEDDPFHLLVVVSSPAEFPAISAEEEFLSLVDACEKLRANGWMRLTLAPGRQGLTPQIRAQLSRAHVEVVDGAASFEAIQGWLGKAAADIHGLHIVAHGAYNSAAREFSLLLEADGGDWHPAADKDLIQSWQSFPLRLVFLQSCQSAVSQGAANDPRMGVHSFMQQLLDAGIPGVMAMQDRILMPEAREFNRGFYTSLVRNGLADEAANTGRALLSSSPVAGWSIPVLATRFAEGALWRTSPLRQAQQRLAHKIAADREKTEDGDFPIHVVSVSRETLEQKGIDDLASVPGDSSAPLAAATALTNAARSPKGGQFSCLVGARGRWKSPLLAALMQDETERFLEGDQPAAPLMLDLADCLRESHDPENTVALAICRYFQDNTGVILDALKLVPAFSADPYLFLVNGDDIASGDVARGVKLLSDFLQSCHPQSRLVMTLDESSIKVGDLPESCQCLVVQPMRAERVRQYLREAGKAGQAVLKVLEDGALYDLAEAPWLLSEMLSQARRGIVAAGGRPQTRAGILERVVRDAILRFAGPAGAARVEEALERLAWMIQNRRSPVLPTAEVYELMARLRGNRDYPLFDFLGGMIKDCRLLRISDEDAVGFNYPGFVSYFSAAYLAHQPEADQKFLLEDITAQLGRQSRVERWSETLFVLAGMWKETPSLLGMILSGSHLRDGDQIYIAARCLQEARLAFNGKPDSADPLVRSIMGSLIRKARPLSMASIATRKKAIAFLGPLREPEAVPELIPIAVDKVRPDKTGQLCYDYSGVRLAAIKALLYQPGVVMECIRTNAAWAARPGLQTVLEAWLKERRDPLVAMLDSGQDDGVCGIAAFALGLTLLDGAFDLLWERLLRQEASADTLWAIADSMLETGSPKLAESIAKSLDNHAARAHITYLIGKSKLAGIGSPEWRYLKNNLENGDWALKGRALESLAELGDESVLPTCHAWLNDRSTIVRYYALEALRHVGTKESLLRIERVRWLTEGARAVDNALYLENLRIETYEDIYWRLAGGLSRETMAPIQERRQQQPPAARTELTEHAEVKNDMPFHQTPDTHTPYAIVAFDNDGAERRDDPNGINGAMSARVIEQIHQGAPTDIFLFSHGWRGDIASAISQYDSWIDAMARLTADASRMGPGFRPLWIGLHWPSEPWGQEELGGGSMAAAAKKALAPADLLETYLDRLNLTQNIRARELLGIVFRENRVNAGAAALPLDVADAYKQLAGILDFASPGTAAGVAPDGDRAVFEPQAAFQSMNAASVAFGGGFLGGLLGPLRILSFWTMKRRARTVGEGGMFDLVSQLQQAAPVSRFHLMGHSFGTIVASSICGGPRGATPLARPIDSLVLVQGAVSLWAFADTIPFSGGPGYFNAMLRRPAVRGPVVTTRSSNDIACNVWYPAAVSLLLKDPSFAVNVKDLIRWGAIGAFGIEGYAGASDLKMLAGTSDYHFEAGKVYNLEASDFIRNMSGIGGAHNDIAGPQVAHALWQVALASVMQPSPAIRPAVPAAPPIAPAAAQPQAVPPIAPAAAQPQAAPPIAPAAAQPQAAPPIAPAAAQPQAAPPVAPAAAQPQAPPEQAMATAVGGGTATSAPATPATPAIVTSPNATPVGRGEMPLPFGVHAATGAYLLGIQPSDLNHIGKDPQTTQLRLVNAQHLAPVVDIAPEDLARAGWGILFAANMDAAKRDAIESALKPLLDRRHQQAGDRFHIFKNETGYQPNSSARDWLNLNGSDFGPVDPTQGVPYYVLLAGDPADIPFEFQYDLDTFFATGRLYFETPDEYARYAANIVEYETAATVPHAKTVALFNTRNDGDRATALLHDQVATPLAFGDDSRGIVPVGQSQGYTLTAKLAGNAKKSDLLSILRGQIPGGPPALLFTGSHGVDFAGTAPEVQIESQGAILTQDWGGPGSAVSENSYFTAAEVPSDAKTLGLIHFFFACYSAGCPQFDTYTYEDNQPVQIAPRTLVARLPQKLLLSGAQAVIGHIDRGWAFSFQGKSGQAMVQNFRDPLLNLLRGDRAGHAMDVFNQRWSVLSSQLDMLKRKRSAAPATVSDPDLANAWVERDDARNYIILGDPAVKLRSSEAARPAAAPAGGGTSFGITAAAPRPAMPVDFRGAANLGARPHLNFRDFSGALDLKAAVSPDCSFQLSQAALAEAKPDSNIDVYIYSISAPYLMDLLKNAHERGAKIRVMYDPDQMKQADADTLKGFGLEVKVAPSHTPRRVFTVCHQKFVVIDKRIVVVESANWATSSIPERAAGQGRKIGNREWLVRIDDEKVASWYGDLFDADWNIPEQPVFEVAIAPVLLAPSFRAPRNNPPRDFPVTTFTGQQMTVTPLTSPDNYFDSVFPMIRGAGQRIWIQQQYIEGNGGSTIPRLLEAIAEKQRAGVDVRLMVSSKFSSAWDASKATIQDAGLINQLKAINLDNFLHLHNKGVIVDDAVVVSSTNWSENSVRQAREAGILIHSAAVTDFFSQVFDDDWRTGWSVATADSPSSSLDVTAGAEVEVDPADRV